MQERQHGCPKAQHGHMGGRARARDEDLLLSTVGLDMDLLASLGWTCWPLWAPRGGSYTEKIHHSEKQGFSKKCGLWQRPLLNFLGPQEKPLFFCGLRDAGERISESKSCFEMMESLFQP